MRTTAHVWIAALAMGACGGEKGSKGDDSGEGGGITVGGSEGGDGGSGSAADSAADSADGSGGASAEDGADDMDEGGAEAGNGVKFDVANMPDISGVGGCGGGMGDLEFSYIWIANSSQNTVSKIHTQTLVEEGRYYTRPDLSGSPSRTSVSLSGDVAVANRSGGLTKFYANPAHCTDLNANGTIETSSGAAEIFPWDDEECRAWHTPFTYTSQRPAAWSQGEWNEATCSQINQKVWTTGVIAGTTIEVNLVNGDSGVVEDSIQVPEIAPGGYGFYGGAVDAEGNLWTAMLGGPSIARFRLDDLADYDIWPQTYGGYGMTVGASGYVFTCSNTVGRFDPSVEMWTGSVAGGGGSGGCMEDANGILWTANNYGVAPIIGIDVETMTVVATHPLPEHVHGISIDFEGLVWGVSMSSNAFRVDPATGTYDTVTGLVGPYTYSDMTGFALSSVGGGPPTG